MHVCASPLYSLPSSLSPALAAPLDHPASQVQPQTPAQLNPKSAITLDALRQGPGIISIENEYDDDIIGSSTSQGSCVLTNRLELGMHGTALLTRYHIL